MWKGENMDFSYHHVKFKCIVFNEKIYKTYKGTGKYG